MKAVQKTPLEQLREKKQSIKRETDAQAHKINNDLSYLHENAGRLIIASAASALLPGKAKRSPSSQQVSMPNIATDGDGNALGGSGLFSIAFKMAQPFLLTWGIKGAKKLIGSLFFKKKNR
ncbi:hypothetical protein M2137_002890 [Parabacteroides sp. PFB2-10]|nr:hypothetical protein [Parabacteroides sp. PFB2-10]